MGGFGIQSLHSKSCKERTYRLQFIRYIERAQTTIRVEAQRYYKEIHSITLAQKSRRIERLMKMSNMW